MLNEAAGMIQNDSELFWRLAPNTRLPEKSWPFFGIISNWQSLREDHEIERKKPKDQIRILFLGDSCTFGYGVARDETFVEVAESLIRKTYGRPVECINAGVPGYTIFQGYRYLLTEGLDYRPDLVVLSFGLNDFSTWDQRSDVEHYALLKAMQPPPLLRRFRLCQLIWAFAHRPPVPESGAEERPRMKPDEFADTLKAIHRMLEKERIPMLILAWPMQANAKPEVPGNAQTYWQTEMTSFGQAHPLSMAPPVSGILNLVPVARDLVSKNGMDAVYFDQVHMRATGHKVIGQAVFEHLEPWLARQSPQN